MRVWIMSDKRHGNHSDRQIEVEWQTEHPKYAEVYARDGDFDPAMHPYHTKCFPATDKGRADAVAFAKTVAAQSFFGCATVCEQYLDKINGNVWDWETVGSSVETIEPG